MSIFEMFEQGKTNEENESLQRELIKLIAEQDCETFLEYDRATDTAIVSEIRNGQFGVLEIVNEFTSKRNMVVERIYEKDMDAYRKEIQRCLQRPKHSVFEVRCLVPDRGPCWYRIYLVSIGDENGYVTKFAARMVNIHAQKEAQEMMKSQTERDALSGVFNHATYERLCKELADKCSDGLLYIMVDIDNFKQINDNRGHHEGDKVIAHVGNILDSVVKGHGYAGRLGGDEFSACFYDVYSREDAMAYCVRIRNAMTQHMNTVPFTISIGATMSNGRKMNFQELYFEADETLYFAKNNGKNQIVFKDEIQSKKLKNAENTKSECGLTEEEIALDQKIEYITIVDPISKRILYMNAAARNILGLSLSEVKQMQCYDLFRTGGCECGVCELHANHAQVLTEQDAEGLKKYIPDGKFILQSNHTIWKGDSARLVTFIDVNDPEHVEICLEAQMESHEVFSKCWSLILESNSGDTEYEKILHVLNDYYDADCCTIVTKDGDEYIELFEYHKNSGQGVAEGLRSSLGQGIFEKCEKLLDEEGFMRSRHINGKLQDDPELADVLEKKFVHSTMGIALKKFGDIIGILMILNPRRNTSDYGMISRIAVFLAQI